jgi:adenine-specific DNA-methyltransferase
MTKIESNDGGLAELEAIRRRLAELESSQGFGLVWRSIPEAVESLLRDEVPVLIPEPALSVVGKIPSDQSHVLIEGDNLHALHVLQATHLGAVDVIYIDPPYNRGKDLIYNDSMIDKADPFRHSKWLSFMAKRLELAWRLLSESGVMFISIDDNSQAQLKLLCDKLFGPDCFVANFVWVKKRKASNLDKSVRSITEYVLCYAKSDSALIHPSDIVEADKPYPFYNSGNKRKTLDFPKGMRFSSIENQTIKPQVFSAKKTHVRLMNRVEIKNGVAQGPFTLEGEWRYSQDALNEMIRSGEEIIFKGVDFKPYFINKSTDRFKMMKTLLSMETYDIGTNEDGNQQIFDLIGNNVFEYPKPLSLITNLLSAVSTKSPSPVILDFFAGSGTTLHAVAQLNAADNGTRQCILVTNNENEICRDITIPRVKAVLTGKWADKSKHDALPGSMTFFTTGFVKRSKSPDRMRTEIAKHTVDLIAVKEGAGTSVSRTVEFAVLHGLNKTVAVAPSLDPDHPKLFANAEKKARDGDRKIVYLFTWSDQGVEAEFVAMWPGWEVEPLPAEMLSAMRRNAPQPKLFDTGDKK